MGQAHQPRTDQRKGAARAAGYGLGGGARSLAFERMEDRHLLTTHPVISELLAVNDATLADEDGDFSDWFEIDNPLASPVDLDGWYVTDDADNLTKWQFPNVSIPAAGQLLVFASDKDRPNPLGELHANFKLSGNGEYLALVEPDGISIAHDYAPQFPPQTADVSYGLSLDGSTVGFFLPFWPLASHSPGWALHVVGIVHRGKI